MPRSEALSEKRLRNAVGKNFIVPLHEELMAGKFHWHEWDFTVT